MNSEIFNFIIQEIRKSKGSNDVTFRDLKKSIELFRDNDMLQVVKLYFEKFGKISVHELIFVIERLNPKLLDENIQYLLKNVSSMTIFRFYIIFDLACEWEDKDKFFNLLNLVLNRLYERYQFSVRDVLGWLTNVDSDVYLHQQIAILNKIIMLEEENIEHYESSDIDNIILLLEKYFPSNNTQIISILQRFQLLRKPNKSNAIESLEKYMKNFAQNNRVEVYGVAPGARVSGTISNSSASAFEITFTKK